MILDLYDRLFWRRRRTLQLVWPEARMHERPEVCMPRGYLLRTFRDEDLDEWLAMMSAADMPGWDRARFDHYLQFTLEGGIYVAEHEATGALVGTARATHRPNDDHPGGGEIAWCAVHRDHRGRRILRSLSARSTRRLLEDGYRRVYVSTHDFRLPSIKTHLRLGFVPYLYAPDMEWRWRRVCRKLEWPCEPSAWLQPDRAKPALHAR